MSADRLSILNDRVCLETSPVVTAHLSVPHPSAALKGGAPCGTAHRAVARIVWMHVAALL